MQECKFPKSKDAGAKFTDHLRVKAFKASTYFDFCARCEKMLTKAGNVSKNKKTPSQAVQSGVPLLKGESIKSPRPDKGNGIYGL